MNARRIESNKRIVSNIAVARRDTTSPFEEPI